MTKVSGPPPANTPAIRPAPATLETREARTTVWRAAKAALARPLVWRATGPLRRGGVAVLAYHRVAAPGERFRHVPAAVFRAQMEWLRANCQVIHPEEIEARIVPAAGRGRIAVLVTFDDGYRDFHDVAYPVLSELGIPAVNFLPTRHIDRPVPYWWDQLDVAAITTTESKAPLPGAGGTVVLSGDGRLVYARAWKAALKQFARPEASPLFEQALAALGFDRAAVPTGRQAMTWDEARATTEWTVFGGHSHTHALMPALSPEECRDEVVTCRARIEAETGRRPRLFAYPGGAISPAAQAAVADGGFAVAFSETEAFVDEQGPGAVDWLSVSRIPAPPTVADLAWLLSRWWQPTTGGD